MPYIAHTPEALIPRSDSKNPATTCKGITSNGRPCRRSLAASPRSSPIPSPVKAGSGVLAVLSDANGNDEGAAVFFCWQHKDQAAALAEGNGHRTDLFPLKERTSIDTLAERLGVLEVEDGKQKKRRRKQKTGNEQSFIRRETLPQKWQQMHGPLMSVPEGSIPLPPKSPRQHGRQKSQVKHEVHFSFFCCMRQPDSDDTPPVRIRNEVPPPSIQVEKPVSRPPIEEARPSPGIQGQQSSSSYTQALLSFIPTSLPSATISLLLTELQKPLSPSDQEPGYIYIFWLAPSEDSRPVTSTASHNLPLHASPAQHHVSGDDILHASNTLRAWTRSKDHKKVHSHSPQKPSKTLDERKTIMLKIGRANNVHRRMNEWTRQCGHPLSLVRYYPHQHHRNYLSSPLPSPSPRLSPAATPTAPATPPSSPGQKVPLVARVERLIHIELGTRRVKRSCEGCGKNHREWFEVDATKEGLRHVDDIVRRWVGWAEREG